MVEMLVMVVRIYLNGKGRVGGRLKREGIYVYI